MGKLTNKKRRELRRQRLYRLATGPAACVGLMVLYAALAVTSIRAKSNTYDEIAHLTRGYAYWTLNDYRFQDNGNLPNRLAALPLLAMDVRFPSLDQPAWRGANVWAIGHQFFYDKQLGNDVDRMLLFSRTMIVLLGMGLVAAVFVWSRRLFGAGCLVSGLLAAVSPTLLAHGRLVTSDLAAGLFFLLAVAGVWTCLRRVSPLRVLLSSLAAAGLVASKLSGLLIVPVAAVLVGVVLARRGELVVCFRDRSRALTARWKRGGVMLGVAGVHVLVVVGVIWGLYGCRYEAFRAGRAEGEQFLGGSGNTLQPGPMRDVIGFAQRHRLLPEGYLYSASYTLDHARERVTFMNGRLYRGGRWEFFPFAFAVKTPEGVLLVLVLAVAGGFAGRWREVLAGLWRTSPLWVLLGVYLAAALRSELNIGHRHLLPIYPVMFILAGASVRAVVRRRAWLQRVVLGLGLAGTVAGSVWVWPDYLSYFNLVSGGPGRGYRKLVDSNLDWGQDLPAVARFLASYQPYAYPDAPGHAVYFCYFGSASPEHYGIEARRLPGMPDVEFDRPNVLQPLRPGTYVISATMLQGVYGLPAGPWGAKDTAVYDALLKRYWPLQKLADPVAYGKDWQMQVWDLYRTRRLCMYLRQRPPDGRVGPAVLYWRVDEAELTEALLGPVEP